MNHKIAKMISKLSAISAVAMFAAACSTMPGLKSAEIVEPTPPSVPVYLLSDVSGASQQTLDVIFGEPNLTRHEGKGEFRRYDLSTCALIIILYPDEMGVVRAAYIDTAAQMVGDEKPNPEVCLAAG